jgi:hypothetical protein
MRGLGILERVNEAVERTRPVLRSVLICRVVNSEQSKLLKKRHTADTIGRGDTEPGADG